MKINSTAIKALDPCEEGYAWYLKHGTKGLLTTLIKVNAYKPQWARWLYTNLMTIEQRRRFAIMVAEKVLPIFEEKYPDDKRPRLAIEAAKLVLKSNTQTNRDKARAAAAAAADAAADAAAYAAYAAAAHAAYYAVAAYAAYAADAADAAAAYAADAAAAYAANRKKMQEILIREAVKILDGKKKKRKRK